MPLKLKYIFQWPAAICTLGERDESQDLRAIIGVLDSFGLGAAPDATRFGDAGANTFGHIAKACAEGLLRPSGKAGPLDIPNLLSLGLGLAAAAADPAVAIPAPPRLVGRYGYAAELGRGKDTPSGHWE
ncbi:MAG: hypothetical protein ACRD5L_04825, partial [Bryobacteraceae bacterium]